MGYDMSIVGEATEAEKQAINEARDKFNTLVAKREAVEFHSDEWESLQEEVMEALSAYHALDTGYFRLNIFGMSRYRRAMMELGMTYQGFGKGIPTYKFRSNDGWLVTPEEIKEALSAWNLFLTDDSDSSYSLEVVETIGTDYWYEWIEFLTRAKDREGFRVY